MHMYICVSRCRRPTLDKQLWGDLANKNGPELTPETIVRVQLMMSVVMYMFVYVCAILVSMQIAKLSFRFKRYFNYLTSNSIKLII